LSGFGYDGLEGVAAGGAASAAFPTARIWLSHDSEEVDHLPLRIRRILPCDILAMVDLHRALTRWAASMMASEPRRRKPATIEKAKSVAEMIKGATFREGCRVVSQAQSAA